MQIAHTQCYVSLVLQVISHGGGTLGFAAPQESQDEQTYQNLKGTVQEAMKGAFKPEFLNRIDEIVVFRQLTKDQVFGDQGSSSGGARLLMTDISKCHRVPPSFARHLPKKGTAARCRHSVLGEAADSSYNCTETLFPHASHFG